MLDGETRINTGVKHYPVTGKDLPKEIYNPEKARAKAYQRAQDFINKRHRQMDRLAATRSRLPIIAAPYDAALLWLLVV